MGESRNAYRNLVENVLGNGPLRRPRRTYKDNIRMSVKEAVCEWKLLGISGGL
jgi:hypothetical protein